MTIVLSLDRGAKVPPSTLQNRLRIAREWRGLEQADLARELGVGRSTVSNYERGVTIPGKLVINAWAVACDVDIEWLRTGQTEDPRPGPGEGLSAGSKNPAGETSLYHLRPRRTSSAPNFERWAA